MLSLGHLIAPKVVVHAEHSVKILRLAGRYAVFTIQNLHTDAWALEGFFKLKQGSYGISMLPSSQSTLATG